MKHRPGAGNVHSAENIQNVDDLFKLVRSQGSTFHIATGAHPVQGTLYRKFVNSKVALILSKTIQKDSSCFNDSEKYSSKS